MIDVLIVGSGPGGLGAAHAVRRTNPHLRVVVLEAGREYFRRFCPVDLGKHCRGCGGICNVISGFGGSMHYGDGIKLSLLPSGRRLIDLFGEVDANRLCADSFDLFTGQLPSTPALVGHRVATDVLDTFSAQGLQLRQYPVAVLGESELRAVIEGVHADLARDVEFMLQTEVLAVRPADDGYTVSVRSRQGRGHAMSDLHARAVVFATGRRGVARTQRILRNLRIPMMPPDFSCGVRFEMRSDYLRATGLSHPDFKVTQRDGMPNKVKTFCFCGGTNGGRVKFTHYQDAFGEPIITLDGHETLERESTGRPLAGNFGLLCQTVTLDSDADRSQFLQRRLIEPYRRLNEGRPVVQTFVDFRRRTAPTETWEQLAKRLNFEPSVHDLATAPLDSLFGEEQHASLVQGFANVMRPMLELGGFTETIGDIEDEVLVMGLEVEFLWSHVAVDPSTETTQPNLFVVGDAAGIAQGVIQAAMMGMKAGETAAQRLGTSRTRYADGRSPAVAER